MQEIMQELLNEEMQAEEVRRFNLNE